MIVLGFDPGTAIVGYGAIETNLSKVHHQSSRNEGLKVLDFGCILTQSSLKSGDRLKIIYEEVSILIKKYNPDLISVESIYFFKNLKTALPVSQAKGVILLAAAQKRIPVKEFTPLQVKMTVVGYGRADKKQVQKMTKELLNLKNFDFKKNYRKKDDAADALGVALCGSLNSGSKYPQP